MISLNTYIGIDLINLIAIKVGNEKQRDPFECNLAIARTV